MPAIFLLGFMCSGKTTLGRALADRLGVAFTDLDDAVEEECGMTVAELFRTRGEQYFRQKENEVLGRVLKATPDGVIALGGGTPCREGAVERLGKMGITIWLHPDNRQRLITRLMEGRDRRPLLAGLVSPDEIEEYIQAKMKDREPFYSRAHGRFDSSYLETENEICQSVSDFIDKYLSQPNLHKPSY